MPSRVGENVEMVGAMRASRGANTRYSGAGAILSLDLFLSACLSVSVSLSLSRF